MNSASKNEDADLLRRGVELLEPYDPGPTMSELMASHGLNRMVKINANESCWGPSPKVRDLFREGAVTPEHYPLEHPALLKSRLAEYAGVGPENLILGNGGDEVIAIVARTFLNQGEEAVMPHPSFSTYRTAVILMGGVPVESPLVDLEIDLDDMAARVNDRTKLVFVCNPNNPTGHALDPKALVRFLDNLPGHVLAVCDEAYWDFMDADLDPRLVERVKQGRRLVLIRTFSKIFGLAGLRLGYGVAKERPGGLYPAHRRAVQRKRGGIRGGAGGPGRHGAPRAGA